MAIHAPITGAPSRAPLACTQSDLTVSTFVAKLLSPIPADEEQADAKQFRKLLAREALSVWNKGMEKVNVAHAKHLVAWHSFQASGERFVTDRTPHALCVQAAIAARQALEHQQCLIPAPRPVDMRWKKRLTRYWQAIPDDIAAAIARDEARLAIVTR